MNTEQIKAKVRNILSSSIGMITRDTALKLLDALEAAERERDELRAGRDTLQRAVDNLDAERDVMRAELARRDAAASKPVAWISERNLKNLGKAFSVRVKHEPVMVRPIALYTAAPPAALPPKLSMDIDPELQGEFRVHEAIRRKGFNQALDAALELGALPKNPVTIPGRYDIAEMSGNNWQSYRCIEPDGDGEYIRLDEMLSALDAANVPHKVKE